MVRSAAQSSVAGSLLSLDVLIFQSGASIWRGSIWRNCLTSACLIPGTLGGGCSLAAILMAQDFEWGGMSRRRSCAGNAGVARVVGPRGGLKVRLCTLLMVG